MADLADNAPAPDALPKVEAPPATPAPEVKPETPAEGAPAADPAKPEGEGAPEAKTDAAIDASLARKQLVAADRKLAKAKATLAEAESLRTRAALSDDVEAQLKNDPEAFFAKFNTSAEEVLTAYTTKKTGQPATLSESERIEAIENERREERETNAKTLETQQRAQVETAVKQLLTADESFDLVNTYERHADVAKAVWEYGKKYPKMTREQAGNAVKYFARQLETQLEAESFEKLTKSKKFGAKYAPREAAPAAGDAPAGDSKTLHNGIVRGAPPVQDDLPRDDAARWREVKRRAGITS
jgi:hypothetical protein